MDPERGLAGRIWRARRRHHYIDAVLRTRGAAWDLVFRYDDRPLMSWPFPDRAAAEGEAARRLRDLQRAGWTMHW